VITANVDEEVEGAVDTGLAEVRNIAHNKTGGGPGLESSLSGGSYRPGDEVNADHIPTLTAKVDGVCPGPAAQVEGMPGPTAFDELLQLGPRFSRVPSGAPKAVTEAVEKRIDPHGVSYTGTRHSTSMAR
jgi:hypothetical protein